MGTLTYSGRLTVSVCWCGVRHAVPDELIEYQERQHRDGEPQTSIYCPLGHTYIISGEGEAAKLRQRLERAEARERHARDQLEASERSNVALQGVVTKTKKRVAGGACPCCKRSFVDVARHMATKHPDYAKDTGREPDDT
jgi:hypothetical protein